ncbi:hypothetical protein [Rhizobium phaseoli]|uniref:hypothetical protein n=1 Tax=Rhizobium phaseoli TaxID=396 RepID=UPI001237435D|nr:hypothetical protein [Rhizobium phaseoli]
MELEERGTLIKLRMRIDDAATRRSIYVYPEVRAWFQQTLPTLQAFDVEDERPLNQLWTLCRAFIMGHELEDGEDFKLMHPQENDVYELRSPDTRVYGWFVDRGIFIAARADSMERVHSLDLDGGYRAEVEYLRNTLNLDEPKYVVGASKEYVFSI